MTDRPDAATLAAVAAACAILMRARAAADATTPATISAWRLVARTGHVRSGDCSAWRAAMRR